jgi:hypothetical protein
VGAVAHHVSQHQRLGDAGCLLRRQARALEEGVDDAKQLCMRIALEVNHGSVSGDLQVMLSTRS